MSDLDPMETYVLMKDDPDRYAELVERETEKEMERMTSTTDRPRYTIDDLRTTPRERTLAPYVRQALYGLHLSGSTATYKEFAEHVTILSGIALYHRHVPDHLALYTATIQWGAEPDLRGLVHDSDGKSYGTYDAVRMPLAGGGEVIVTPSVVGENR